MALCFAALLALRNFPDEEVVFLADCTSALSIAEPLAPFLECMPCYVMELPLRAVPAQYQYVPAHQGVAGNELVDLAAKLGDELCHTSLSRCHAFLRDGGRLLPWAVAVCQRAVGDTSLPHFDGRDLGDDANHAGLSAEQILQPFSTHMPCSAWS